MKAVAYDQYAKEALEQLQKGAFLTVKTGEELNTMTIAWGNIGYMWNRPVFTVMVRCSRHTHELMEKAEDFTISFPLKGQIKQALGLCGSKSGRDHNKFKLAGITATAISGLHSPIVEECDLHYACRIVFKQTMDAANMHSDIQQSAYSNGDFHVFYYGEILQTLVKETL